MKSAAWPSMVPKWDPAKCIQCNRCAMACPHAAIRPVLLSEEEAARKPASFVTVKANGLPQYQYRMQVSPYDAWVAGVCANVCLAKETPGNGALCQPDSRTGKLDLRRRADPRQEGRVQ